MEFYYENDYHLNKTGPESPVMACNYFPGRILYGQDIPAARHPP
ncbi:hypothetical protein [Komagataeibacter swingsii]|nr:hypothetical protein [Komagataeibacter swingsii]